MNKCVVTGTGMISSICHDVSELEYALRNGKIGIKDYVENDKKSFRCPVAKIEGFDLKEMAKKYEGIEYEKLVGRIVKTMRRYPRNCQMGVMTVLEAYIQSGLIDVCNSEKSAVIVAGSNMQCGEQFQQYKKYLNDDEMVMPSYAINFFDTSMVGIVSELFDVHGEGYSVGGASASGNVALIKAMQLIQDGRADSCIVLGMAADFSPVEIEAFSNLGAMCGASREPEASCCPFDEKHSGFVMGEMLACVILENEEIAKSRGANILAEFISGFMVLHGSRLSEANEEYECKAMRNALQLAGMTIDDIDYINAHGTSTPLGDITEMRAIQNLISERTMDRKCWVNSTKGMIGHGIYSAGIAEAIASILQMRGGFVHPNVNLTKPVENLIDLVGIEAVDCKVDVCMSNSFGFGGINSSIILGRR